MSTQTIAEQLSAYASSLRFEEVPADVRDDLKVHLIRRVDEVLSLVLEPPASMSVPPADGADPQQTNV